MFRSAAHTEHHVRHVADRDTLPSPNIDHLSKSVWRFGHFHKSRHRVLDEGKIAHRRQGSQTDCISSQGLTNNGRNDRARRLAWPKGIERTYRGYGEVEGAIKTFRQLIGGNFARRVR